MVNFVLVLQVKPFCCSWQYAIYILRLSILDLPKNKSLTQFLIVSSKDILGKRLSKSKLAMAKLQSVLAIYLPNAKESLTVYSLIVSEDEIDRRHLANLCDGVRIA